jgi:hypothetical protein
LNRSSKKKKRLLRNAERWRTSSSLLLRKRQPGRECECGRTKKAEGVKEMKEEEEVRRRRSEKEWTFKLLLRRREMEEVDVQASNVGRAAWSREGGEWESARRLRVRWIGKRQGEHEEEWGICQPDSELSRHERETWVGGKGRVVMKTEAGEGEF